MYGSRFPATTNKLLVSMKTRTPSGKTLRKFREIDEYETFNDKGKDINLALSTRRYVYISSTLSNMTVATRHVSWQEDISLKHPSTLCTHQSYLSEASV
jgi:hypothetical protein